MTSNKWVYTEQVNETSDVSGGHLYAGSYNIKKHY